MLATEISTASSCDCLSFRLDCYLRSGTIGGKASIKGHSQDKTESLEHEVLYYCCICGGLITKASYIIQVNGQHQHTYANPAGHVFKIGCFSKAPGCISHGIPTPECTWFAGFSWNFVHCIQCETHLGWKYVSKDHGNFMGLILGSLICK